jgi:hypothetical protein
VELHLTAHHDRVDQVALELLDRGDERHDYQRRDDPVRDEGDERRDETRGDRAHQREEAREEDEHRQRQHQRDPDDGQPGTDQHRVDQRHERHPPNVVTEGVPRAPSQLERVASVTRRQKAHSPRPDPVTVLEKEEQHHESDQGGGEQLDQEERPGDQAAADGAAHVPQGRDAGLDRLVDVGLRDPEPRDEGAELEEAPLEALSERSELVDYAREEESHHEAYDRDRQEEHHTRREPARPATALEPVGGRDEDRRREQGREHGQHDQAKLHEGEPDDRGCRGHQQYLQADSRDAAEPRLRRGRHASCLRLKRRPVIRASDTLSTSAR